MKAPLTTMKTLIAAASFLLATAAPGFCAAADIPAPPTDDATVTPMRSRESDATLVVFNSADPASSRLAAYYAKRRGIPQDHILGLDCPGSEQISRATYDETIAGPLRTAFEEHGWWSEPPNGAPGPVTGNEIRFIALMRGIPLKISGGVTYPGDRPEAPQAPLRESAAAVDSELAMLGVRTQQITGPLTNIYYKSQVPFMDAVLPPMMLVCRLDGPTEGDVRSMIDGALAGEKNGLQGFAYLDMRGITSGAFAVGDEWLATAGMALRRYGMPMVWDNAPTLFPADFPMTHTAFYLGWYDQNVNGPMARDDFRFVPGAIAVHIHSFSAATLRDAKVNWCGPLIAHGAAATMGNVYEPFLALTPNLDIFADRLRNGMTFAEAAYSSEPVLSWMTTFIGDPLYRPFRKMDETPAADKVKPGSEYAAYLNGARVWYGQGRAAGEKQLAASAKAMQSGIVWEGLGLLQWSVPDADAALASFKQAEKCYGKSEDAMRVVLHQVELLRVSNRVDQARALAGKALGEYGQFHGAAILRSALGMPPPPDHK